MTQRPLFFSNHFFSVPLINILSDARCLPQRLILAATPSVAFRVNPSPLHSPHTPASLAVVVPRHAVVVPRHVRVLAQHSKGWDGFGKGPFKYYNNFDAFMSPFPAEDRETYPEMFALPKGVREVSLPKPLGIAFEERCNYVISQGLSLPRHPPPASLAAAGSRAAASAAEGARDSSARS